MPFDIKKATIKLMEATENPLAAIIVQDAHSRATALARILVPLAKKEDVDSFCEELLTMFPKDDAYASDPAFIIALCSLLASAITEYVLKLERS